MAYNFYDLEYTPTDYKELKIKIIIGLAVGIVIDLLAMIIQIVNIRRSEI